MSDDVDRPGAGSQSPANTEGASGQPSVRRVVDPDLLWVESVTERLLGNHEPSNWKRATIGDPAAAGPQAPAEATPADDAAEAAAADPTDGADLTDPAGSGSGSEQPDATVLRLPIRTPRAAGRPLSYAEALAERPRVRVTEVPPPVPYFAPRDDGTGAGGDTEDPATHTADEAGTSSSGRGTGEAMPASLLRAALRDALPDDAARRPSPVDAIFGDRSWEAPPERDEEDGPERPAASGTPTPPASQPVRPEPPADLAPSAPYSRPSATAPSGVEPLDVEPLDVELVDVEPVEVEPVEVEPAVSAPAPAPAPDVVPSPSPTAPSVAGPVVAPSPAAATAQPPIPPTPSEPDAATGAESGSGRHRNETDGNPDIDAIRMALRSGDESLAAAVLSLIADRGRERERLRMVEAYLDAVIAEGDEGLSGAARLRRLLGE